MKKIIKISFVIAVLAMISMACEKEEERAVVGKYIAPGLSTTGGNYVFLEEDEDKPWVTFEWSAADFGFQSATNYTIQFDATGNDFAEPKIVGATTALKFPVTVGEMNNKLLSGGGVPDLAGDFEFRVMAVVHKDVDTLYSSLITMNITPFEKIVIYPSLYTPGTYQAKWDASLGWGEWDASNEHTKIYSVNDDGIYEGYLYFNEDTTSLKFTKVNDWVQEETIGDPDASGWSGTLQVGDWGGNNINTAAGPGYIQVKADLNELKSYFTLTEWGIIGTSTAGGWDSDQNMTYDPVSDTWSITSDLTEGVFKFRANDDWAINLGDPLGNGRLAQDGKDIPLAEAGNYTITLDLSEAIYTYTVVKN